MIPKIAPVFLSLCLGVSLAPASFAEMAKASKDDKSPSREQVLWTETDVGLQFETDMSVVGGGQTDFGQGRVGDAGGLYGSARYLTTVRKLMAVLFHGGVEWQRLELGSSALLLPRSLNSLDAFLGADFRWSEKSQLRLQVQPGFYSDFENPTLRHVNIPLALAYTRIPSNRFQWTVGLSMNTWRASHFLPGGGFRWYINDRWKLKFLLPEPALEYKANDFLHLSMAADFRGDTYRMSRRFGDDRGNPALNNALLDYQEIRVGPAFSWNIKPLIELNGQVGYMMDRSFDFHNNDLRGSSDRVPFVRLSLRMLFQVIKDPRPVDAQIRAMQYEFPALRRFFKVK